MFEINEPIGEPKWTKYFMRVSDPQNIRGIDYNQRWGIRGTKGTQDAEQLCPVVCDGSVS